MGLGGKSHMTYSLGVKYGLHSGSKLGSKSTAPAHVIASQKSKETGEKKNEMEK
tara:strand:+ start:688 stop:849 length:162 start_codon:yes stop_codon:yes gene_type:complete